MADSPASYSTKYEKVKIHCPNSGSSAHTSMANPAAPLTRAQIRRALAKIDIRPSSRLMKSARYRAYTADTCADDLLQEAILRAMTSRSCPAGLMVEHFLMGIMRSIASEILAKRERVTDALLDFDRERPAAPPTPEEEIAFVQRAETCRQALKEIAECSPETELVVDGIDQGLCGKALAQFAGIDQARLATIRRFVSRRSAIAWAKLDKVDEAA